jgi:hypothetical protein
LFKATSVAGLGSSAILPPGSGIQKFYGEVFLNNSKNPCSFHHFLCTIWDADTGLEMKNLGIQILDEKFRDPDLG